MKAFVGNLLFTLLNIVLWTVWGAAFGLLMVGVSWVMGDLDGLRFRQCMILLPSLGTIVGLGVVIRVFWVDHQARKNQVPIGILK